MPTYFPQTTGRGSKNSGTRNKPWVAKRTRYPLHFHLGYYATREEAVAVEQAFDRRNPPRRNINRARA